MNATEDGEPLGEAPEGVHCPAGSTINVNFNPNLVAAISEVRALHHPNGGPSRLCAACVAPSPCPTIAAFDKWGV